LKGSKLTHGADASGRIPPFSLFPPVQNSSVFICVHLWLRK
jgi:hypothetical protein